MNKRKINLYQFARRHGLKVERRAIRGPRGEICEAFAGFYYFQTGTGYQKFDPVAEAKQAIETVGLQFTVPPELVNEGRREFLIATKRVTKMTMQEFAERYGLKYSRYHYGNYIHKSRRQAGPCGRRGFIFEGEGVQMTCNVTGSRGGGFEFDPNNPMEAATAVDAIGLDHR